MGEQVRLTVPERPMVVSGRTVDVGEPVGELPVLRPARAGDRIEVECDYGFCDNGTERGYGFDCERCGGTGVLSLTLTEDPEQTFVRMGFGVDGYGWLVVGETD